MANGDCVQENGKRYRAKLGGYCRRTGRSTWSCRGHLDIRRIVENKLECLGLCFEYSKYKGHRECKFWTYDNVRKMCNIMNQIGTKEKTSSEFTSGNRDCTEVCNYRTGEANITYPGNDLNDGRKNLTLHAKDCDLLCYKDMQCVGWVWKAKTGECWKKSKMENRTVDTELGTWSARICEQRDPDDLDWLDEEKKNELYDYENEYES